MERFARVLGIVFSSADPQKLVVKGLCADAESVHATVDQSKYFFFVQGGRIDFQSDLNVRRKGEPHVGKFFENGYDVLRGQ